jgi:hypothetical protein
MWSFHDGELVCRAPLEVSARVIWAINEYEERSPRREGKILTNLVNVPFGGVDSVDIPLLLDRNSAPFVV